MSIENDILLKLDSVARSLQNLAGNVGQNGTASRDLSSNSGLSGVTKAIKNNTAVAEKANSSYQRQLENIMQFQASQQNGIKILANEYHKFATMFEKATTRKDKSEASYRINNLLDTLDGHAQNSIETYEKYNKYIQQQFQHHAKSFDHNKNLISSFAGTSTFATPEQKHAGVEASKSIMEAKRKILNAFNPDKNGVVQIQSFKNLLNGLNLSKDESSQLIQQMFGKSGVSNISEISSLFSSGGKLSDLYNATDTHLPMEGDYTKHSTAELADTQYRQIIDEARAHGKIARDAAQAKLDATPHDLSPDEELNHIRQAQYVAIRDSLQSHGIDYDMWKKSNKSGKDIRMMLEANLIDQMRMFDQLKSTASQEQNTLGNIEKDISGKLLKQLQTEDRFERAKKYRDGMLKFAGNMLHSFMGFSVRSLSLAEGANLIAEGLRDTYKMWASRVETGVWQGFEASTMASYKMAMTPSEVTAMLQQNKMESDSMFNGNLSQFESYISHNQVALLRTFGSIQKGEELRAESLQLGASIGVGRQGALGFSSYMMNAFSGKNQPFGLSPQLMGMTQKDFDHLATSVLKNSDIQEEMFGMTKRERAVMARSLIQRTLEYKAMGLTTKAAEQAATAMTKFAIDNSPKQRLQTGAKIAQAMMMVGMNPSVAMQTEHNLLYARQLNATPQGRAALAQTMQNVASLQQIMAQKSNSSIVYEQLLGPYMKTVGGMLHKLPEDMAMDHAKRITPAQQAMESVKANTLAMSKSTANTVTWLQKIYSLLQTPLGKMLEGAVGTAIGMTSTILGIKAVSKGAGLLKNGAKWAGGKISNVAKSLLSRTAGETAGEAAATDAGVGAATDVAADAGAAAVGGGLLDAAGTIATVLAPEVVLPVAALAAGAYGLYDWLSSPSKKKQAAKEDFSDTNPTIKQSIAEQTKYHSAVQLALMDIQLMDKDSLAQLKLIEHNTDNAQRLLQGVFDVLYEQFVNKGIVTKPEARNMKSMFKQTRNINGLVTPV